MNIPLERTPLMVYLKSLDERYHAKVLELREAVTGWLTYIPETFPHYTRHTVQHSDEIVVQMSKLLFPPGSDKPVIQLSAAEAYIVIAAAYLHDSGMVAAEQEKLDIITSDSEWKSWISGEGGGAKRWREIEDLRAGKGTMTGEARRYVADLQTRYLIAEFIRRSHHLRAANVIQQYEAYLGRFAFGDPMVQRTIADICVAHGLMHYELNDRDRYPELRDIQGYAVNVRLLAILLRLGDLLDMSYDRACPLLLNAANPLPADSLAHWTQYQRITQRATSPTRIEITADCHNQEEHRVLQDWCQWIADETRNAKGLMSHAELHHEWQPPKASLDGADATIKIRPAQGATYIPSSWVFEIDHSAILQLLIRDLYNDPLVFIRELIQNALDATRCKMYSDLAEQGIAPPQYPTHVDEALRIRYPIKLALETRSIKNEMSGEIEERQVFSIDDPGLGMDREIIQRFFLQVGRSYYKTEEFRSNFHFTPTSRFGVGFLSVFAVSDDVSVETYKPNSQKNDPPIRLRLRGPRNYLLTELSTRRVSGTRIEVILRDPIKRGLLTRLVSRWCRRVEFPLFVTDLGAQTTIVAERPEQFLSEVPSVSDPEAKFIIRAFPIEGDGIEGEIYIFATETEQGDRLDLYEYSKGRYLERYPQAVVPSLPEDLICLHGISFEEVSPGAFDYTRELYYSKAISARVDLRHSRFAPNASRSGKRAETGTANIIEVFPRFEKILREHLQESEYATSDDGWRYRQRLVSAFPFHTFWASLERMIPVYIESKMQLLSLSSAQSLPILTTILHPKHWGSQFFFPPRPDPDSKKTLFADNQHDSPYMISNDIDSISTLHLRDLFVRRTAASVTLLDGGYLAVDWSLSDGPSKVISSEQTYERHKEALVDLPDISVISTAINIHYQMKVLVLNQQHPFIQWLIALKKASADKKSNLRQTHLDRIIELIKSATDFPTRDNSNELANYVVEYSKIPGLPSELTPPMTEFKAEMFLLKEK